MPVGRRSSLWIAAVCVAVTAVSGGAAACSKNGSDSDRQSQAADQPAEKPKTQTTGTAGRLPTLADYIKQNDITETEAQHDNPDVPKIVLPMLPGWADAGAATPAYAYAASIGVDPAMQPDPPTIVAVLSKLSGNVDPADVLSMAPNEVRNLADFKGSDPVPGKLANFDATRISGQYTRGGESRIIEQTTTVIPVKDGLYVLQINVDGVKEQIQIIMQAVDLIDTQATITA